MFLDKPGSRTPTAAAPQLDVPASRAGQSGVRQCRDAQRRRRPDAPARDGRDRLRAELPQLIGTPAAADDEGRHAAFFRRQLQPPALREVEGRHLRHHRVESGAAQRFLHRPERIGVAIDAQMQQPVGIKTAFRQGTGIEIALPRNPQRAAIALLLAMADEARHGRGGEARFLKIGAMPHKLMQGAAGKAAAGQMPVDGAKPPGEVAARFTRIRLRQLFQQRYLPPQARKPDGRQRRSSGEGRSGASEIVFHDPFLFHLAGESRNENI